MLVRLRWIPDNPRLLQCHEAPPQRRKPVPRPQPAPRAEDVLGDVSLALVGLWRPWDLLLTYVQAQRRLPQEEA